MKILTKAVMIIDEIVDLFVGDDDLSPATQVMERYPYIRISV